MPPQLLSLTKIVKCSIKEGSAGLLKLLRDKKRNPSYRERERERDGVYTYIVTVCICSEREKGYGGVGLCCLIGY